MKHWRMRGGRAAVGALAAMVLSAAAMVLSAAAMAQHGLGSIEGSWHVAVPGWGIEDHLLVLRTHEGVVEGKFEFADVKGTVSGAKLRLDVTGEGGRLMLHFEGAVAGDRMSGEVTTPKDGPLAQHGVTSRLTTEWTAVREPNKP